MKVLFIYGTRPEAIKMAPLVKQLQEDEFDVHVCVTGQHREMLDQVLTFFEIAPEFDLNLMKPNQTLFDVTADGLKKIESVLEKTEPDLVIVQGDTTTAFVGALAAFYKKIKIAHLEAGLRSQNKYSPYPEEVNRLLISNIADYHFAPTSTALENLQNEKKCLNAWNVGNTVVDALLLGLKLLKARGVSFEKEFPFIDFSKRIVLITSHRRESFGEPFENICKALLDIAGIFDDIQIVYPVHPNPNISKPAKAYLSNNPKIHLIEPLDYQRLIWLMDKSYLILTDSGGIQEEAPTLKKPVLVLRDVTERMEGVLAGTAKLVGTNRMLIVSETSNLLNDPVEYNKMASSTNPYGTGDTSKKISELLKTVENG